MPGRLIPNLIRNASSLHSSVSSTPIHSNASSTVSVNEIPTQGKKPTHKSDRARSPERRLSFTMDQLIHPLRDHSKEKRRSLGRAGRSKERSSHEAPPPAAKLDVLIESPPLVCYGPPTNSTGALFSGRLRITVSEASGAVVLSQFDVRLVSKTTTKKPVSNHCANCATRTEELTQWNFINHNLSLAAGDHDFPFSYLFPGHLPASCNGVLGKVEYFLLAHAQSVAGEEYSIKMPLELNRSLLPGPDKSSIRIFPPTNLTGRIVLPSVVHPIGSFPVEMTLSGVVDKGEKTQTRWRLRKMMWRIEEQQKIVSPACPKHLHKIGGEGKGVMHQETRVIGHNEEKTGWKTDFDTAGGEITMQFDANINPSANAVCDMEAPGGLEVKHNLVIELIVAEEFCPNGNTRLITPTGAARVLRMQFNLHFTQRGGLGISWDEEMPPIYEDVPASPPSYKPPTHSSFIGNYEGSPLSLPEYDDLDRVDSLQLEGGSTDSSNQPTHGAIPGRLRRFTSEDLVTGVSPAISPMPSCAPSRAPSVELSRE
ncbi:hypothetical protein N7461_002725 [Penicillium sp. DV-2018c]|nr:hypothetical protein N7461_002725 [Penicillium sp. DV-2018c]